MFLFFGVEMLQHVCEMEEIAKKETLIQEGERIIVTIKKNL